MATPMSNSNRGKKRKVSLKEAVRMIVDSDNESEDVVASDVYDSNELETEDEWTDDDAVADEPEPMLSTSRLRKRTHIRTDTPPDSWTGDTSLYSASSASFKPADKVGPRNIPDSITEHSKSSDFFSLLWTDDVWNILVTVPRNPGLGCFLTRKPGFKGLKLLT